MARANSCFSSAVYSALVIDAATEVLAGVWTATVPASVHTLDWRITGSDVVHQCIDDDYRYDRREHKPDEPDWESGGLVADLMIFVEPPKRQDVFKRS